MTASFRTQEVPTSQIPAMQLLQSMGYVLLTEAEALRERRGRLSNVLLEDVLEGQLKKINRIHKSGHQHEFTDANIADAIQRLKSVKYDGLLKTNEAVFDLLALGTTLEQTIDGDTKSHSLRFIDWDKPENNAFHVCAEFEVERTRSTQKRRPDLVLFVNGIPFVTIECKRPTEEVEQAVSQTIRNQKDDQIPKLFTYVQMVIGTNKNEVKYGTVGTPSKFWALWREREITDEEIEAAVKTPLTDEQKTATFADGFSEEQEPYESIEAAGGREVSEQDRVLFSLCRRDRLIDMVRRFILFDAGEKKIARYQQYFAVKNILARVEHLNGDGKREGGVIWHTQGSGKSLTMVMMAKALALKGRDPDSSISNPRVVLVTDRKDLDRQIEGTFKKVGMTVTRAKTGAELVTLVQDKEASIITTLVHKFDKASSKAGIVVDDPNVFLLIDESHRTQYGRYHARMRSVFPRGCYIGFTGTPLLKKEKSTFAKFGDVIDTYPINQAVADGAVVPLLYEGRMVEQDVNAGAIDAWFERICKGLTEEQKADLKKKFSRADAVQNTEQTLRCIAFDVLQHFTANWQGTGRKAQLVARSKVSAIRLHNLLEEFGGVSSAVVISAPDDREGHDDIDTDPDDEVQKFWRLMMKKYGSEDEYNKLIIERFLSTEEPEIIIVVDKLLTGFDAPRNTVLYLARKMKEHNLLQAIARVNRLYEDTERGDEKEFGYIIDYANVLGELDKALTSYSAFENFEEADLEGTLRSLRAEVDSLPQRHADLLDLFREVKNAHDEEAYEQFLGDDALREEFYDRLSTFARTLHIAMSSEQFLDDTPERKLGMYRGDLKRFQELRLAVKKRYAEIIDYSDYEPKIQKLLDQHISAHDVRQLTGSVNIFDDDAFKQAVGEQTTPAAKADMIAHLTKRTLTERMEQDPALYKKFSEMLIEAIADWRAKRLSDLDYLKRVEDIRDRVVGKKGGDVPETIRDHPYVPRFFNNIRPILAEAISEGDGLVELSATAAQAIFERIERNCVVNWTNDADVQNAMRNDIDDYLFDVIKGEKKVDLTTVQMDAIIETSMQLARHNMMRYTTGS